MIYTTEKYIGSIHMCRKYLSNAYSFHFITYLRKAVKFKIYNVEIFTNFCLEPDFNTKWQNKKYLTRYWFVAYRTSEGSDGLLLIINESKWPFLASRINAEPFKTFRSPLCYKSVTGKALFLPFGIINRL